MIRAWGALGAHRDPYISSFHFHQWPPVQLVLVFCGWRCRGSSKHRTMIRSPAGPLCLQQGEVGRLPKGLTICIGICIGLCAAGRLAGWLARWEGLWAPLSSDQSLCSLSPQAAQCYLLRRWLIGSVCGGMQVRCQSGETALRDLPASTGQWGARPAWWPAVGWRLSQPSRLVCALRFVLRQP